MQPTASGQKQSRVFSLPLAPDIRRTIPTEGDASIPTPLHTAPAPTRQGDHLALVPDLCWNRLLSLSLTCTFRGGRMIGEESDGINQ
jgi:hypothetical protein